MTQIIGHRGVPWEAPENTLASLRLALERGLDGIEYDLQATRDGDPVLPGCAEGAVAAYYFWLFPNLMLNLYPWGISVNVVEPLGLTRTRVRYFRYLLPGADRKRGAGSQLDLVEQQDDAVVEQTQLGVGARLYGTGRYSPREEVGVHHFHRLLTERLA